jgi:hypothetical protein
MGGRELDGIVIAELAKDGPPTAMNNANMGLCTIKRCFHASALNKELLQKEKSAHSESIIDNSVGAVGPDHLQGYHERST